MPDLAKALKSFGYAFSGLSTLFRLENNFKIHLIAGSVAVMLGVLLKLNYLEWVILVIQITIVLAAEAFNTSIETLSDAIHPSKHPAIKKVKDIAAAAVLLAAAASVITGIFLFVPKILSL